jgi:nitrous oxidase accessory protein NosD
MSHVRQTLFAALAVLMVSGAAAAVTIHVPAEQPTIQQGIDAAAGGDTVLVASDIYVGALNRDLDFGGTNILVISESGPGYTVIDCEDSGRAFFFHSGEDTTAVVRGFTITNAAADTGAGAYCRDGSSPRFEDCTFVDCSAQLVGGGLCCYASSPVVRNCEFVENSADEETRLSRYGGGVCCLSGSSPLIADTQLTGNYAYSGGGGLYSYYSSPQLFRCGFLSNQTAGYGCGAGAAFAFSHGATLVECVFEGNGVWTSVGGGMHVSSTTMTVTDCDFIDNISGASGGIHMTGATTSAITGCTFVGNMSGWSSGGGLLCYSGSTPMVTGCTFVGNSMHQVWCNLASPTLEYCIFAYSPSGLGVNCESGTETPSINHCFVFGNAGGDTLCGGNYHDIEYVDPRFCGVESGDVTLCADSPCLPGATWTSLVGAEGEGCAACGSAVEQLTWGAIKAMYR